MQQDRRNESTVNPASLAVSGLDMAPASPGSADGHQTGREQRGQSGALSVGLIIHGSVNKTDSLFLKRGLPCCVRVVVAAERSNAGCKWRDNREHNKSRGAFGPD